MNWLLLLCSLAVTLLGCEDGSDCTTCSTETECNTCRQLSGNKYIYDSINLSCVLCNQTIPHCSTCANATSCSQCIAGYFSNLTNEGCGSCQQAISGCTSCQDSSVCLACNATEYFQLKTNGKCECIVGYVFKQDQKKCLLCKQAISNCITCSGSQCVSCQAAYFRLTGLCVPCIRGCIECTNQVTCNVCSSALHYSLQLDLSCACRSGYIFKQDIQQCVSSCDPSSGPCQTCLYAQFMNSTNQCQSCKSVMIGCTRCPNATYCYYCDSYQNFQLDYYTNGCQCIMNMIYDQDLKKCVDCSVTLPCKCYQQEFLQVATGLCVFCRIAMDGCYSCTNSSYCLSCKPDSGLVLEDDKCVCEEGLFLYKTLWDTSCKNCSEMMSGCLECNDSEVCTLCEEGKTLWVFENYPNSVLCRTCQDVIKGCIGCINLFHCYKCNATLNFIISGVTCICPSFYYFNHTSFYQACQPCTNWSPFCLTCSNLSCIKCRNRYQLTEEKKCIPICNISLCLECFDNSTCELCFPYASYSLDRKLCTCDIGYFKVAEECKSCLESIPHCKICKNAQACIECEAGYYVNVQVGICVQFDGIGSVGFILLFTIFLLIF